MLLILEKVSTLQLKDFLNAIKPHHTFNRQTYPPKILYYGKYLIVLQNPNIKEDNRERNKLYETNNSKKEFYIVLNDDLNEIQRRFTDVKAAREEMKQARLLKSQQERKVKEITDFMADHFLTANYLYEEVQRIKRQRMVKDDLRKMVEYLEKPEKKVIKAQVMKCYREARKTEKIPVDEWGHDTNNLVVNIIRDPYNFGYIN